MPRGFTTIATIFVLLLAGLVTTQSNVGASGDLDVRELAEQRLKILGQRVRIVEMLVERGQATPSDVIQTKLDVIDAKLVLAKTNDERRALLDEKVKHYDRLIERAEFSKANPTKAVRIVEQFRSRDDLLYLKAERIQVLILRESIP